MTTENLQALIDYVAATQTTDPVQLADGQIVSQLVPAGYHREQIDMTPFMATPTRKRALDTVHDTDSFIKLVARHEGPDTIIYTNPEQMRAYAVFNDHSPDTPGWRDHRLTLQWKPSPGWTRWFKVHRQLLEQDDFAELVEDGLTEILKPTGADLLELAQSIKASTNAQFRSDRRLANGQVQFSYHEEVNAAAGSDGTMTIPSHIQLLLAPLQGTEPQPITARLRYRIGGGKLRLGVIIDQIENLLLEAVDREVAKIEQQVQAPIVVGSVGS